MKGTKQVSADEAIEWAGSGAHVSGQCFKRIQIHTEPLTGETNKDADNALTSIKPIF